MGEIDWPSLMLAHCDAEKEREESIYAVRRALHFKREFTLLQRMTFKLALVPGGNFVQVQEGFAS
jgi:hypothetical protein